MLKTIALTSISVLFLQSISSAIPIPSGSNRGDVFNGNSNSPTNAQFGASPSVCNDPQISQIERSSGTTARVFEPAASGSKQGRFGRWLETNGYVDHTGVCAGTGYLVMFIYNSKIPSANRVANEYFASNSSPQNKPPDSQPVDEDWKRRCEIDNKNLIEVCEIWFQQRGNFDGRPSCTPSGVKKMYENCIAQNPNPSLQGSTTQTDGPSPSLPSRRVYDSDYNKPSENTLPVAVRKPKPSENTLPRPGRKPTTRRLDRNPITNNEKPTTSQIKLAAAAQRARAKGYFLLRASKSGGCVYSGSRDFDTSLGYEKIYVCIGSHPPGETISGEIYQVGNQEPYFRHIEGYFLNNKFYVTKLQGIDNMSPPLRGNKNEIFLQKVSF